MCGTSIQKVHKKAQHHDENGREENWGDTRNTMICKYMAGAVGGKYRASLTMATTSGIICSTKGCFALLT